MNRLAAKTFGEAAKRISCRCPGAFAITAAAKTAELFCRLRTSCSMEYEHPFIAEVRAHPDEDEPRLIYADYLEEAGEEQGELIRVQVALARLPPGDPARRELELREEALLAGPAEAW